MTGALPHGLTLDTGALIALESGRPRIRAILDQAIDNAWQIAVPSGVIAQAWRGGPRQARVARLLADSRVEVIPLTDVVARAVGLLIARCGHRDVVDVSVALCAAERRHVVVTSDPDDITSINPRLVVLAP